MAAEAGWTAEENRHGDLLNAYLRLTGRVDMRSVERTVHHLIRNGVNVGNHGDDYAGLIYAAFQERATRVTHGNVGGLAAAQGDETLAGICRKIAGDDAGQVATYRTNSAVSDGLTRTVQNRHGRRSAARAIRGSRRRGR